MSVITKTCLLIPEYLFHWLLVVSRLDIYLLIYVMLIYTARTFYYKSKGISDRPNFLYIFSSKRCDQIYDIFCFVAFLANEKLVSYNRFQWHYAVFQSLITSCCIFNPHIVARLFLLFCITVVKRYWCSWFKLQNTLKCSFNNIRETRMACRKHWPVIRVQGYGGQDSGKNMGVTLQYRERLIEANCGWPWRCIVPKGLIKIDKFPASALTAKTRDLVVCFSNS